MAKIPQGILGGVSGKIGGVIGSSWKGINVIKTKPLSVSNPRTVPQLEQRAKFKGVTQFGSQILADFIKPYWDRFAVKSSGYNEFVKSNIGVFVDGEFAKPLELVLSKGKMAPDILTVLSMDAGDEEIDFTWLVKKVVKFKAGNDLSEQVCVAANGDVLGSNTGTLQRDDLGGTIRLNRPAILGETLYVYMVNRRADGTVVSDTAVGSVVVN